jgi:archaellum component FlaC
MSFQYHDIAQRSIDAWRNASKAIDELEALMAADNSAANTLDSIEFDLVDCRKAIATIKEAAIRLDRTIDVMPTAEEN